MAPDDLSRSPVAATRREHNCPTELAALELVATLTGQEPWPWQRDTAAVALKRLAVAVTDTPS